MTLEQQVASLVAATTELTNVVNSELDSVRAENNNFKNSSLADIDSRFNTFISGFDQVKLRSSAFTIYVDPISGSAFPVNPVNNQLNPFDTIANAVIFLSGYYWTNGIATIKLSAGNHAISSTISISHPCPIRIEGVTVTDLSGVQAIVSKTTNANRSANASTTGSNANLFDHLESVFQSRIVSNSSCFSLESATFYIRSCLIYTQNKNASGNGINLSRNCRCVIRNCAIMYFSSAISSFTGSSVLSFEETVITSANNNGCINYGSNITGIGTGFSFYTSGNASIGFYNFLGSLSYQGVYCAYGNGSHGICCNSGEVSLLSASISSANGGCGFYNIYGSIVAPSSMSQDNALYGYRSDVGIIKAIGSDTNTTGNTLGKKLENNAQQAYVIGVNA